MLKMQGLYEAAASAMMFRSLVGLMGLLLIVYVIVALIQGTKTRQYRKVLTDLFVAGRIRQLAADKKIEIADEYENFKAWNKKQQMYNIYNLDNAIEQELIEETGIEELKKDVGKYVDLTKDKKK